MNRKENTDDNQQDQRLGEGAGKPLRDHMARKRRPLKIRAAKPYIIVNSTQW